MTSSGAAPPRRRHEPAPTCPRRFPCKPPLPSPAASDTARATTQAAPATTEASDTLAAHTTPEATAHAFFTALALGNDATLDVLLSDAAQGDLQDTPGSYDADIMDPQPASVREFLERSGPDTIEIGTCTAGSQIEPFRTAATDQYVCPFTKAGDTAGPIGGIVTVPGQVNQVAEIVLWGD